MFPWPVAGKRTLHYKICKNERKNLNSDHSNPEKLSFRHFQQSCHFKMMEFFQDLSSYFSNCGWSFISQTTGTSCRISHGQILSIVREDGRITLVPGTKIPRIMKISPIIFCACYKFYPPWSWWMCEIRHASPWPPQMYWTDDLLKNFIVGIYKSTDSLCILDMRRNFLRLGAIV